MPRSRSSARNVLSGTIAAWSRIFVTIGSQLLLVPIFLSNWSSVQYGAWLVLQASSSFLQILDTSHQDYVGNEFLRLGRHRRRLIRRMFWSACTGALGYGLLQVTAVVILISTGLFDLLVGLPNGTDQTILTEAKTSFLVTSIIWCLTGTVGGVGVRVVAAFGYYSKGAWWGVSYGLLSSLSLAAAVLAGGGLLIASIAQQVAIIVIAVFMFRWLWHVIKIERLTPLRPSAKLARRGIIGGQALTIRKGLEMLRHEGARLVLSPLAGSSGLAAFTTMRTGANISLQGISTITGPLMPELMRFLAARDQSRSEAAFSTVWLIVIVVMAPCVLVVQLVAASFFYWWTRNKIPFDPVLFAVLSSGVLTYASAQPAMAVMRGNNLVKSQLTISVLAGLTAVAGMFFMVPRIGIVGAGWALLASEVVATMGYKKVAARWLKENGLRWPLQASRAVTTSVVVTASAMLLQCKFPHLRLHITCCGLIVLMILFFMYWRTLPASVRGKAINIMERIPIAKRLVPFARKTTSP